MIDWLRRNAVIGAYQAIVGVVVVAALTAAVGWLKGLGFVSAVLFGLAIVFVLTLCANMISRIIRRHESSFKSGQNESSQIVCPYEFAHDIADLQRREIRQWIRLIGIEFINIDLFRSTPRLEFAFHLHNQSLYEITFTHLTGSILYGEQPIGEKVEWIGAPPLIPAGAQRDALIRLTVDQSEVARILNTTSAFTFTRLCASLETAPKTSARDYSFAGIDLPGSKITEKYPKLRIEIHQCLVNTFFNFDAETVEEVIQGAFVSTLIELMSPRSAQIQIVDFKLDTSPHVERVTAAATGLIYRTVWINDRRPENHDRLTPNLRDDIPIEADRGEPILGWVQFYLTGVRPEQLAGKKVTLVLIDRQGEEHRCATPELNIEQPQRPKTLERNGAALKLRV